MKIFLCLLALAASSFAETDEEWKKKDMDFWKSKLTPTQIEVCRKKGTERAFSSPMHASKEKGIYHCSSCGLPLYESDKKFDSGTGWPSYWKPIEGAVELRSDDSWFMKRTEVVCRRCGAHLGHVFDDGPAPTGKRYCMNAVCLRFEAAKPDVKVKAK